jgi:hypothetical protein
MKDEVGLEMEEMEAMEVAKKVASKVAKIKDPHKALARDLDITCIWF